MNEVDADVATPDMLGPMPRAEQELCLRAGAVALPRHRFLSSHVFPRLTDLAPHARDACLVAMLLDLPRLTERGAGGDAFADLARRTPFVPTRRFVGAPPSASAASAASAASVVSATAGAVGAKPEVGVASSDGSGSGAVVLRSPEELFDPEVAELRDLVDPALFPAAPFDGARTVAALRALGLQVEPPATTPYLPLTLSTPIFLL